MKIVKKQFLRYCAVASTVILLAAASLPDKEKISSISNAPPLFQKNNNQPKTYTYQYADAHVKTALISFQGYLDEVFHFPEEIRQRIRFSPPPTNANFNSTDNCLLAAAPGSYQLDTVKQDTTYLLAVV